MQRDDGELLRAERAVIARGDAIGTRCHMTSVWQVAWEFGVQFRRSLKRFEAQMCAQQYLKDGYILMFDIHSYASQK